MHRDNLTIPIVTDDAKNMECAVRLALCVGPHKHVGCFTHTINLACQRDLQVNTLARLLAPVGKIVSYFHRSNAAATLLTHSMPVPDFCVYLPRFKTTIAYLNSS